MFAQAATASKEARLRSLRDLDAAALKLRDAGNVILDEATPDGEVRAAVFALIDRDALAVAVERVGALAEPNDDTYFAELRKHHRRIRYAPALLAGLDLGSAPAGKPLLAAVEYLRVVHAGGRRPGPPPTAFVPKGWSGQLTAADGSFDLTGYRLCVLDGLRRAIRRRDVFPVRSLRYARPEEGPAFGRRMGSGTTGGLPNGRRVGVGRRGARPPVPSARSRLPRDGRACADEPGGGDREYRRRP